MMISILENLFAYVASKQFKKMEKFFLGSKALQKFQSVVNEWKSRLPDTEAILSNESILDNKLVEDVLRSAESQGNQIPLPTEWLHHLQQKWQKTRDTLPDPAPFFKVSETRAREHLLDLSKELTSACTQLSELDRPDSHNRLNRIEDKVDQLLSTSGNSPPPLTSLSVALPASVTTAPSTESQSPNLASLHSRISKIAEKNAIKPEYAIEALTEIKAESWHTLDKRGRYRVLANIGHAYEALGDVQKSAQYFAEAYHCQPNDPDACALYSLSLFLQKDDPGALLKSRQVLESQPTNLLAAQIYIATMPPEDDCLALIDPSIKNSAEVIHALARKRLIANDIENALTLAKKAKDLSPADPMVLETYLGVTLEIARRKVFGSLADKLDEVTKQSIDEIISESQKFLPRLSGKNKARIHFILSRSYSYIGEDLKSERQAALAIELDPSNLTYAVPFLGQLIRGKRPVTQLNDFVTQYVEYDSNFELRALLVSGLQYLDNEESVTLASTFLLEGISCFETNSTSANLSLALSAIQHFRATGDLGATKLMFEVGLLSKLQPVLSASIMVQFKSVTKAPDFDIAVEELLSELGRHGVDSIPGLPTCLRINCDLLSLTTVADALRMGNCHVQAFEMWRSVLDPSQRSQYHDAVLEHGEKAGRLKETIEYFEQLRAAGNADFHHFQIAISILNQRNCFNRLIPLCHELLSLELPEKVRFQVNATLARLKGVVPSLSTFVLNESTFPSPKECSPENGLLVVAALRNDGQILNALEYAYQLIRYHFSSPFSHMALLSFLFFRELDLDSFFETPEIVQQGVCVEFREIDRNESITRFIEAEPHDPISTQEISIDDRKVKGTLNCHVGDVARVPGEFLDREITVASISNRFAARLKNSLENWESRFPDNNFIFSVPDISRSGMEQLQTIGDSNHAYIESLKSTCRTLPVGLSLLSHVSGQDTISSGYFLMMNEDIPLRCVGVDNPDRSELVTRTLDSTQFLIDRSALATLHWLDASEVLGTFKVPPVVSWGTVFLLKHEIEVSHNSSSILVTDQEGLDVAEHNRRSENLIESIFKYCTIVDPIETLEAPLDPQAPINSCGKAAAEVLSVAASGKYVFWCDDAAIADLAKSLGCRSVAWTEIVLEWLTAHEKLSLYACDQYLLKLLSAGFIGIRVSKEWTKRVWEHSQRSIEHPDMQLMLRTLQMPVFTDAFIHKFAIDLLLVVNDGLTETVFDGIPTFKILSQLEARVNGRRIIGKITLNLPKRAPFELKLVQRILDEIEVWQELRRSQPHFDN